MDPATVGVGVLIALAIVAALFWPQKTAAPAPGQAHRPPAPPPPPPAPYDKARAALELIQDVRMDGAARVLAEQLGRHHAAILGEQMAGGFAQPPEALGRLGQRAPGPSPKPVRPGHRLGQSIVFFRQRRPKDQT